MAATVDLYMYVPHADKKHSSNGRDDYAVSQYAREDGKEAVIWEGG